MYRSTEIQRHESAGIPVGSQRDRGPQRYQRDGGLQYGGSKEEEGAMAIALLFLRRRRKRKKMQNHENKKNEGPWPPQVLCGNGSVMPIARHISFKNEGQGPR